MRHRIPPFLALFIVRFKSDIRTRIGRKESFTLTGGKIARAPSCAFLTKQTHINKIIKDGQFLIDAPEGLIWVEYPGGALCEQQPPGITFVWYHGLEYSVVDDVVFRKTPEGFLVIAAPWGEDGP